MNAVSRVKPAFLLVAKHCQLGLVFASIILLNTLLLRSMSTEASEHLLFRNSTNVVNLMHAPVRTLISSIFWVNDDSVWQVCLFGFVSLTGCQMLFGWRKALLFLFGCHAIASIVSELGVFALTQFNALQQDALYQLDVGPSYVLIAGIMLVMLCGEGLIRYVSAAIVAIVSVLTMMDLHLSSLATYGHILSAACAIAIWTLLIRNRASSALDGAGMTTESRIG